MDRNENVMVPHRDELTDVHSPTMGGKHQRSLSLSAKWASDKAMAFEYLRRQREVMAWIESVLKRELPTTDLFEALKSGVVLREMMETLFPDVSNCMSPISRSYSTRMAPWKERENISVFLRQCKSIGMNDLSLFCTDDLYEGTNMVQVLFCVQHFMMFSEERVGHLYKPVVKSEPAMFSNQELEMAMSKIEQAGVDVKAFQGLISSNISPVVPESISVKDIDVSSKPFELVVLSPRGEKLGSTKEEEYRESVEFCTVKTSADVPIEVCNQISEDKLGMDNHADDEDLNPAQESGSDAGDKETNIQAEGSPQVVQDLDIVEAPPRDYTTVLDEETLAVVHTIAVVETVAIIQQVLSNLVTTVVNTESQTRVALGYTQNELSDNNPSVMEEKEEKDDLEEVVDDANIELGGTVQLKNFGGNSTDAPVDSTPTEKDASTQPLAEIIEEHKENLPRAAENEELEAKAMSKCTCGKCTIM